MRRQRPGFYTDPSEVVTLEIEVPSDEMVAEPAKSEVARPAQADTTKPLQKVLLLEDRDDFREVLCDYLASRSFQVISVPSGIEGLREVTKGAFDLVICDMMMPQMGGEMFYWAVTRIRPATADRFIFFTGHQNNPGIEYFFERVSATVLIKPFTLSALDSTIRKVLGKQA
jgi:CheY-like chemotaxis protein